uniref:Uncharacterized protein n=1 Tax=Bactrocera dorsalis TaxID=27457 RepID=A0A034VR50_BACDO
MILSKILLKTKVTTDYYNFANGKSVFALIWDIIKDLGQLLKVPEVQFLLGAGGLLLIGWHCLRKYSIGIIAMIVGAVVCFGYFHTYLECNRKLEAERLLEMLARHEPRWYTPIVSFFTSSEQQAQKIKKEYIKQASQLNWNFCRPDHVFLLYVNDLFLKKVYSTVQIKVTTIQKNKIKVLRCIFFEFLNYFSLIFGWQPFFVTVHSLLSSLSPFFPQTSRQIKFKCG